MLPCLKQNSTFSGNWMTLVENVKFLDQVDARVVMTKADALRGRTFKPDKRRNYVSHFASILALWELDGSG